MDVCKMMSSYKVVAGGCFPTSCFLLPIEDVW